MLSWQCFLFNTLHIAFNCSGLIVYGKKLTQYNCHLFILNVIWLLYTPLIFPFFLIFSNFTVRYEDVSFYLFLLQFVNALESQHIFFINLEMFSAIISLNCASSPFSLLSLSGILIIYGLDLLSLCTPVF